MMLNGAAEALKGVEIERGKPELAKY